ncbi:MAG TPA: hypothetical protein VFZ80_05715 [Acidimicrobiia bacterium]
MIAAAPRRRVIEGAEERVMYRETVHTARYIQEERQRQIQPRRRQERHSFAPMLGRVLVDMGERLQRGTSVSKPVTEV